MTYKSLHLAQHVHITTNFLNLAAYYLQIFMLYENNTYRLCTCALACFNIIRNWLSFGCRFTQFIIKKTRLRNLSLRYKPCLRYKRINMVIRCDNVNLCILQSLIAMITIDVTRYCHWQSRCIRFLRKKIWITQRGIDRNEEFVDTPHTPFPEAINHVYKKYKSFRISLSPRIIIIKREKQILTKYFLLIRKCWHLFVNLISSATGATCSSCIM